MSTWSNTLLDSFKMVKNDVLYLVPLYFAHAIALFIGLQGIKHLSASVVASLENIDGAIATIIIYFYYLLTDYIHPSYGIDIMNVIATVAIIIGVILLGREEQALMRKELQLSDDKIVESLSNAIKQPGLKMDECSSIIQIILKKGLEYNEDG